MKKVNLLSKAELRKIMGGNEPGRCWKCCPDGEPDSPLCSDPAGPGEDPICGKGRPYVVSCP